MSLIPIIAMLAAQSSVSLVGVATQTHLSSTVNLPTGAQAGDYAIVLHLDGVTMSGGSGNAWTTFVLGGMKVEHRTLVSADITAGSFSLSGNSNNICAVLRNIHSMGSAVSSASFSSPATNNMTGFTKSASAAAYIGLATSDKEAPGFTLTSGRFSNQSTQGSTTPGFGVTIAIQITPSNYANGTNFPVTANESGGSVTAAVYELF